MRNILWDVDGTLFDTYPAITYAISQALNGLGESAALNVIDGLARQSIDLCLGTLAQRLSLDVDVVRRCYLAAYAALPLANQPPFPGAGEVCATICQRGGVNVAVTHRGTSSTQALLDAHGLADRINPTGAGQPSHWLVPAFSFNRDCPGDVRKC